MKKKRRMLKSFVMIAPHVCSKECFPFQVSVVQMSSCDSREQVIMIMELTENIKFPGQKWYLLSKNCISADKGLAARSYFPLDKCSDRGFPPFPMHDFPFIHFFHNCTWGKLYAIPSRGGIKGLSCSFFHCMGNCSTRFGQGAHRQRHRCFRSCNPS